MSRRISLLRILPLGSALALAACGLPANVVVLVPDEGGSVGKVAIDEQGHHAELSAAYAAVGTSGGDPKVFVAQRPMVEAAFAGALAAKPPKPVEHTIFFVLGEAEIDPGSLESLKTTIAAALATPYPSISVVGHTDAIGNDAENLALSLRRAVAVREALIQAGVPAAAIDVGYYGSTEPLVSTPPGVPEPRNRRVGVTIR